MVGDHPTADISGGRAAGLSTGWVSRGKDWPRDIAAPDHSAATAAEVIDAVVGGPYKDQRQIPSVRGSFAGRPIFIFGCPAPLPESRERPCFDKWPRASTSVNCSARLKPRTVRLTLNGGKYGSGVAADINGPIVLDDQFDCRALSGCRSRLQLLFPGRAAMLSV